MKKHITGMLCFLSLKANYLPKTKVMKGVLLLDMASVTCNKKRKHMKRLIPKGIP